MPLCAMFFTLSNLVWLSAAPSYLMAILLMAAVLALLLR